MGPHIPLQAMLCESKSEKNQSTWKKHPAPSGCLLVCSCGAQGPFFSTGLFRKTLKFLHFAKWNVGDKACGSPHLSKAMQEKWWRCLWKHQKCQVIFICERKEWEGLKGERNYFQKGWYYTASSSLRKVSNCAPSLDEVSLDEASLEHLEPTSFHS